MIEERDEGQAAIELALVLPLVVVVLLAVVQVTLVARDQVLVVHAARVAARQAAVGDDVVAVRRAVEAASGLKGWRLSVETSHMGPGRDTVITRVRFVAATDVALVGRLLPDVSVEATAAMADEMSDSGGRRAGTTARQQDFPFAGANPAMTS